MIMTFLATTNKVTFIHTSWVHICKIDCSDLFNNFLGVEARRVEAIDW